MAIYTCCKRALCSDAGKLRIYLTRESVLSDYHRPSVTGVYITSSSHGGGIGRGSGPDT